MKPLLILSILFFTSCGHNSSEQTSEVLLHDTSYLPVSNSKFKEFECGTSELLKTQMLESGLRNPDNFKEFSFITSKNNFFSLLSIAKRDSLIISSFSTKQVKDFYIPTSKDSIWLTLPFKQACYIKKGQADSFPINISYSVDIDKRFVVCLASDSTITNSFIKIITDNKLGKIKA